MKHIVKADDIVENMVSNEKEKVYGLTYNFSGNTATIYQFFLTDSTKHFLRGSMYFNLPPNPDSLDPVSIYIKEDLEHYKVEVSSLQHQLRRTSEQVLSYERIHHDLEERLEKVTKEKINLGKKFSNTNRESLKQLAKAVEEKGDWEKRYNKQSLRCQALSETIRNLEKELYMMHLRKYEFMKTSEESTRRSGGLPFPINVSSLSFDKNSSVISDDDRLKLAQEQEAARIVANCSPSSEDPNPVHALARELALQRGKGQLIKNLSVFFGCV